ncbi:sulfatase-like hydrolase/transferase [Halococcus saccharolyticus]|uniref:Arylsulfatase n=1 Tax=Halococcus saccharolyticus DSM 5350 TaxID=1227455 RepID=M0MK26_9EURY|nr:sulfatase-like hydrolase/transferase [Halococcus saccharolyticus]EMA44810.1 arylsulfatase [Halococcus saccharolyticus DSM 5350]
MTRNIVLVTVDSLRADHCGFLDGDPATLTPTLDTLAEEGVVFENAIAPGPRTPSSMPASFTGEPMRPAEDDGEDYWQRQRARIRRHMQRHRSVAERLRDRGYATIGVTANPWTQGTAFDAGFDRFVAVNGETLESYGPPLFKRIDRGLHGTRLGDRLFWHNKREWFIRWTDFYDTITTGLAAASRPVFLWVFLLDTHQPYITPRRFRRESSALGMYYASFTELSREGSIPGRVETRLRQAYRDSVRSTDAFIDRLWHDCADDDPILVVHGDHGEAFGEHGTYGHERQLYGENLHVPFLVANAGQRARIRSPTSLRRLPNVITALAERRSFDPVAFGTDFVTSTTENGEKTAVSGRHWRYILNTDGEELYHLASDPYERTSVAAQFPAVASSLRPLAERQHDDRHERVTIADAARTTAVERREAVECRPNRGVVGNE